MGSTERRSGVMSCKRLEWRSELLAGEGEKIVCWMITEDRERPRSWWCTDMNEFQGVVISAIGEVLVWQSSVARLLGDPVEGVEQGGKRWRQVGSQWLLSWRRKCSLEVRFAWSLRKVWRWEDRQSRGRRDFVVGNWYSALIKVRDLFSSGPVCEG